MDTKIIQPESKMMQFVLGKWISKPIYISAKLGIADILSDEERSIEDIAKITATLSDPLYRMMRALSGIGIFTETENRVFKNTPLSECIMEGRLKSAVLMFHSSWHDNTWDNLLYTIKTGKPSFDKIYGEPAFDWFEKNPAEAEIFNNANSFKAAFSHRVITEVYDFTNIKTLVDVGGGLGSLLIEILKANVHMEGVVAELPETQTKINEIIRKNKLEDRMSTVACDFFESIPGGSHGYLLSHVLHDWPDEKCITILKNCRKATGSKGRLIIAESIIPPGNEFSLSKFLDLEVLLMGGGRERNEEEFRKLLKEAGFHLSQIIHTEENISIIEGIPN